MTKPTPKLSAMPRLVKERIVDSLDTAAKLSLRQVNFEFKETVGNSKIHFERLKLSLTINKVKLCWQKTKEEAVELAFIPKGNGYTEIRTRPFPVKTGEGDYRKAAVAKMISVFKYPKISVGELVMEVENRDIRRIHFSYQGQEFKADRKVIFAEIGRILSLKNFRGNVGMLETRFPISKEMLMSVLPYLEPGTLKSLQLKIKWFSSGSFTHSPGFDDRLIIDTEQWRQLKEVSIEAFGLNIPFEKYSHLEKSNFTYQTR